MPRGGSRTDVPRRIGGERVHELPLSPAEGYLLSQIDGRTSVAELAQIVGLPDEELDRALQRLIELRLVETGSAPAPGRPAVRDALPPPHRPATPPPTASPPPASETRRPAAANPAPPRTPAGTPRPDAEPARPTGPRRATPDAATAPGVAPAGGSGGMSPEERKRVETFLMRAESVDFYRLLGVPRAAERAEIRSAYFSLAKEFHPDAYYGREIGEDRQRLERIFRQITRAYEVLSRTKSRREYDEYIKGQAVLQGREEEEQAWQAEEQRRHTLYGAKATAARDASAEAAAQPTPQPAAAPPTPQPAVPSAPPAAAQPTPQPAAAPPTPQPGPQPATLGLSPPVEPAIPAPPAADGVPRSPRAAEGWQRMRMARQLAAMVGRRAAPAAPATPPKDERRGGDYLADAETARKDAEWGRVYGLVEAAEKLGLTEAELARAAALREEAARELARISLSQSRFSESTGDVGAAMQHAEHACRYGPDDAECWDTVARLGLRVGRELHRARDAAAKAIQLAPRSMAYRLTMIRVYLAAGLPKNARREAEAALELNPNDKQAKALLADARAQCE